MSDSRFQITLSDAMEARISKEGLDRNLLMKVNTEIHRMLDTIRQVYQNASNNDLPDHDSGFIRQYVRRIRNLCLTSPRLIDASSTSGTPSWNMMQIAMFCELTKLQDMFADADITLPEIDCLMPTHRACHLLVCGQKFPDSHELLIAIKLQRYDFLECLLQYGYPFGEPIRITPKQADFLQANNIYSDVRAGDTITLFDICRAKLTEWATSHGRMPNPLDGPYPLSVIVNTQEAAQHKWERFVQKGSLTNATTADLIMFASLGKLPQMFEQHFWQSSSRKDVVDLLSKLPACLTEEALARHPWLSRETSPPSWQERVSGLTGACEDNREKRAR